MKSENLVHHAPAFSNHYDSYSQIIELFLNLGALKSRMSIGIDILGFGFKRVSPESSTDIGKFLNFLSRFEKNPNVLNILVLLIEGSAANGLSSLIYTENLLVVPDKSINIYQYDYKTICRLLNDPAWTKAYDFKQKVPYAYNKDFWISYDNFQSYQIKVDTIKQKNIKGVFTSFLNSDDFNGLCDGGEKYPVTKYLKGQFKQPY